MNTDQERDGEGGREDRGSPVSCTEGQGDRDCLLGRTP